MHNTKSLSCGNTTLKYRIYLIITLIVIIFLGAAFLIVAKEKFNFGIKCPFYELFGVYCPACGGTRMLIELYNCNIHKAFRYNPFVCASIPVLIGVFLIQSYVYIKNNKILTWVVNFILIYAIALIIYAILRNTSTFSYLMPTKI